MSSLRAKSFAFAFEPSKLSEVFKATNTYVLEVINIVTVLVTWLLLSRNTFTLINKNRKTWRRFPRVACEVKIEQGAERQVWRQTIKIGKWWLGDSCLRQI